MCDTEIGLKEGSGLVCSFLNPLLSHHLEMANVDTLVAILSYTPLCASTCVYACM